MKKRGFTLAELLVALTIIGVISALTIPSLINDTSTAQIGPKLAKAVSMFEQANENLLTTNSVDFLTDTNFIKDGDGSDYGNELSRYLKISMVNNANANHNAFLSKDGIAYLFDINTKLRTNTNEPAHMQRIGDVTIDINGPTGRAENGTGFNGTGIDGTDVFYFSLWNDGSLRPRGATNWDGSETSQVGGGAHWSNAKNCPNDQVPLNATFCAGHIFENNLKVLYR